MKKDNIDWAIKSIQDYYSKFHGVEISEQSRDFLNAILQEVDSVSWRMGYNDAEEDNEVD